MPFITPEKRALIDKDIKSADEPGDLCYYFYKQLVEAWKQERRWTTAHNLYKKLVFEAIFPEGTRFERADWMTALNLAWQVFFVLHVMAYEEEKMEANGDI